LYGISRRTLKERAGSTPAKSDIRLGCNIPLDKQSGEFDILKELADIDAIGYAKLHPKPEDTSDASAIGKATAFRHNLIGGAAAAYSGFFADSVNALDK
jgi:hypothetical protein